MKVNKSKIEKVASNKIEKYEVNYLNVVNTFNCEVYKYFADSITEENLLTKSTQLMGYRIYLEKKRLEKLGLRKIYSRTHPVQHKIDNSDDEMLSVSYRYDGRHYNLYSK